MPVLSCPPAHLGTTASQQGPHRTYSRRIFKLLLSHVHRVASIIKTIRARFNCRTYTSRQHADTNKKGAVAHETHTVALTLGIRDGHVIEHVAWLEVGENAGGRLNWKCAFGVHFATRSIENASQALFKISVFLLVGEECVRAFLSSSFVGSRHGYCVCPLFFFACGCRLVINNCCYS